MNTTSSVLVTIWPIELILTVTCFSVVMGRLCRCIISFKGVMNWELFQFIKCNRPLNYKNLLSFSELRTFSLFLKPSSENDSFCNVPLRDVIMQWKSTLCGRISRFLRRCLFSCARRYTCSRSGNTRKITPSTEPYTSSEDYKTLCSVRCIKTKLFSCHPNTVRQRCCSESISLSCQKRHERLQYIRSRTGRHFTVGFCRVNPCQNHWLEWVLLSLVTLQSYVRKELQVTSVKHCFFVCFTTN